MGRKQYLERLALGRSAFENLADESISVSTDAGESANQPESTVNPEPGVQQYDNKGRPKNPTTEAFNARLRHAQNSVLALVGVVERKESRDLAAQHKLSANRAFREHLLQKENDRGDELESVACLAIIMVTWWPDKLLRRLATGTHGDRPFAEIMGREWHALSANGWRGLPDGLWPGMGAMLGYWLAWYVIAGGVEEVVSWAQIKMLASKSGKRKTRKVVNGLATLCDILTTCIDNLVLPIELHSIARQLGFMPSTASRNLPYIDRCRDYMHILLRIPVSLAFPLLTYNLLNRSATPFDSLTGSTPPGASPPINEKPSEQPQISVLAPFTFLQNGITRTRQRILAWTGWDMAQLNPPGSSNGWETDLLVSDDYRKHPHVSTHRSTALARLPAQWLCGRIDNFLLRLLLLPLEGLVMQSAARWWLGQGVGRSSIVSNVAIGPGGWRRASHVGLGLLLNMAVEGAFFAGVWATVRWQGVSNFGWQKTDMGKRDGQNEHPDRSMH